MFFSETIKGLKIFLFGSKTRTIISIWLFFSWLSWFFTATFVAVGVLISALSTLLIWNFKKPIRNFLNTLRFGSKTKFLLIGGFGALWIELEFWVLHKITGAQIVASTDLLTDLFLTLPWYMAMLFLLWIVLTKYRYSLYQVLLMGGVYSLFAEGTLKALTGEVPIPLFLLFLISFPANILSYSFTVFPAAALLGKEIESKSVEKTGPKKYLLALLPIAGLLVLVPAFIITVILTSIFI